ncbi:hypothetical protein WH52_06400 [Tenacibaculum holothuriorum]|uniref:PKD domain-containing protein n=1 Tax=Tenacibaculum holothuriorum TaxID=1635173 RepID=A0A1Y2PD26_9FLAO|nr:T9SS type B sorting domain-containing protein [Tenacibaculum holothuriorum]OSY88386.1 hypothetical protein WH52_06400 [Tenacibaculum holothuriorum]
MKRILSLLLTFFTLTIFSQKEANIWYFGENAGLDFNTTPPTALTNGSLSTLEGCSSFSDVNGNILFYSDGTIVYDKNGNIMTYTNGNPATNLKGNPSSTQSGMIIPKPKSTSIYYIFTVGDNGNPTFDYYTVDMSLNGGLGQLIDEDGDGIFFTNLSGTNTANWTEKVAAVRGKECNTFWVVSHFNNRYHSYKVTETGVDPTPVVSVVNHFTSGSGAVRGYLKLSPDGSKLAMTNQGDTALLYSFDNELGTVSNDGVHLLSGFSDGQAYGVEFSRDSKKLYISTTSGFRNSLSDPETTYKLFQFDLTQTDIPASKSLIHEQIGFRGALQLGPDGKIYATIPLTYSDPNGFATRLSIIENPSANAADVVFTQNGLDLNGRRSTQGLPPFISSLLLPIEIKDQTNNTVVNNQTIQLCVGDSKTIAPDPVTGNNVDYLWSFNNGTTTTTVSNTINLVLTNLATTDAGTYKLTVTLTDDCGNKVEREADFKLEIYPPTVATKPSDIFFCDVDNDGFNAFDLETLVTPEVLNGQSNTTYQVKYFTSMADATANTNELPNPYTNPTTFSNQTIYARMHNTVAPNACFDIQTFTLAVTGKPIPQTPTNYEECDDTSNGGDTDGFFNNFILRTKDSEILGTLPASTYHVSYHTTPTGAQTDRNTDVIDKNAPFRNQTVNSQPIYVRVENNNNAACNDTSIIFNLVVNSLPVIANNPVEIRHCDTDADLNTNINLTLAQINISNNHANETFKYYPTENDAINDSNEITNQTAHPVTNGDSVWARTISNKQCYRISRVNIVVGFSADVAYNNQFEVCDDFLDADGNDTTNNNDTDGITTFDISSVVDDVKNLPIFPPALRPDLDVLIFESIADRDAVQNAITNLSNYRNKNVPAKTPQPLYIKIINTVNNDCTGIGQFTIWAQQPPIANKPSDIIECDDFDSGSFDDGMNVNINLRDKVSDILGPTQSLADYTVTFYTDENDANTGNNPIPNDTNYTNQTRDKETIYVRVQNNATNCFNDHVSFDIIINPIPVISNTIPPLAVCDVPTAIDSDPRNRVAQNIPLGSRDVDVLNGRDDTRYVVSYHRTRQNALDGVSPLSKTNYSNDPTTTTFPANLGGDDPATEILFISLLDTTTGCRNGITTLQLIINPEPNIPVNITNYEDCDNETDDQLSDTNGINGDITLKNKIPEILANYPTAEHSSFKVTFHENQADAQSSNAPLNEDKYQNTTNNQTIYVRVQNLNTSCVYDDLTFSIIINTLPDFTVDTPRIVCKGEQIRLEAINPAANYDYKWIKDGDPTNVRSTEAFYDITEAGDYLVTATTKDGNNCERTLRIHVDPSSKPTLTEDHIIIEDDTNNNGLDIYSIKINTQISLGDGDYEFAIIDENNIQSSFQDEPVFENIKGGVYTVVVQDKNGCQPNATLDISVIEYPKFITPNGDPHNSTWKIKGANSSFYPTSSIHIFDRFGKIVAIIPIDSEGWDGTFNGKVLPSSDYWFKAVLVNRKGKMFQHQGHFSLIRR